VKTFLRDLIEIPERVFKGDFVLRLGEGVEDEHAAQTVDQYVVTPQLARCFDEALGLIGAALDANSSKAAYLHGSFGSGKSHFMAVLHLLLRHDPRARSLSGLAEVVARHDASLAGKRFLLPTYHLLDARTLEDAVLGGYVRHVATIEPEGPVPPVYASRAVFGTVDRTRELLGDDRFFAELNKGKGGSDDDWGDLGAGWTAETYKTAAAGSPTDADHQRLVSDVVTAFLPEHGALFHGQGGYVDIDSGLSIISQHARGLGYDAVVLFLDELVLWLMTRLADQGFVTQEATKVSKLVEAAAANRPAPLISFVARQRDLRDLVGKDLPGAEQLSLLDALKWWEGRFATITLEDRNLPAIAERRILRPRDDNAKHTIDEAFEDVIKGMSSNVVDISLGKDGDRARFRQTYPFTPAFVDTLVAASSALQRQRTALKVMVQVLVDRRSDLTVNEVVPVGDLYDALDATDEPFSTEMSERFAAARRLYDTRLRPLLLDQHEVADSHAAQSPSFRADDRIVKTLLLAALVPNVDALQGLDGSHLVALNWGQIKGIFPGQETSTVVGKLRNWAARVGELKLSDDPTNPTVSIQLSGIDLEAILERARHNDTDGERRRLIRELLLGEFGIDLATSESFTLPYPFGWRGSKRGVELAFDNVRDTERLPDAALRPTGTDPKVVVDLPFDDEGYGPKDDVARIQEYRQAHEATETICWLPNFLSRELQADLGTLVILEYVLTGERLQGLTEDLPPGDRPTARQLLQNQRDALRQRVKNALAQAYGATGVSEGLVAVELDPADQFQSLDPAFAPRPALGPTLERALEGVCHQLMEHRFPAHPLFESDIRDPALQTVLTEALRAAEAEADNGRIEVEKSHRTAMTAIAQPLRLGTQHEVAFVLDHHWKQHFDQQHAVDGASLTVKALREYIDRPRPMGIDRKLQDLLILVYAAQAKRSFWLGDSPYTQTKLGTIPDDCELREQKLPDEKMWEAARSRAAAVFGLAPGSLRTASEVARLTKDLKEQSAGLREGAARLIGVLDACLQRVGLDRDESGRWQATNDGLEVLNALADADDDAVINVLAKATLDPSAQAVGTTLSRASLTAAALENDGWPVLEKVLDLADQNQEAAAIRDLTLDVFRHDEHASPEGGRFAGLVGKAADLLASLAAPATPRPGHTPAPPTPAPTPPGFTRVDAGRKEHLDPDAATLELERLRDLVARDAALRLTLDWIVEREDDA
jgi:hypothetical protein